jgi:hypothetical protein
MLAGCRSAPPPASDSGGENRIRSDEIYECRGVDVRTSTGGLPFNPFPARARMAYFLRFYPDGNGGTCYAYAREPITTAQALELTDKASDHGKTYLPDDHRVNIVFGGSFPTYADGVIRGGQLILRWTPPGAGPEGPEESYVFRFVRSP